MGDTKDLSLERSLSMSISLGDKVVVDRLYIGTVKYIGRVGTKKHNSLGIELDVPNGENNGSRAGRVYFQCKPRHGIFREFKDVKKYKPLEYNQTGIINTTEIEEVPSPKVLSELLNDNVEIQRMLEELRKENKKLEDDLEKEKKKVSLLENEIILRNQREKAFLTKSDKFGINSILTEIINKIKEKIEIEQRIFK
ncbi:hypothetical protein NEPAR06_1992 [Nematocida parisii]|nr:uncharacterized protein NEPG_00255 [Nematocida parisii ERTm1]KAI5130708.1 hypothetical protein NEPAR03_2176 [Nematocida parisii]EIJ94731.1 hypothetical protein NEPG_00255 [Nematocida parisii ERTm1]KAI5130762.1 hypothetical protein NEPAR08_2215 [Nematocida parisii]KAI5144643.1 hypothetical protein NEPAR04_2185 [Nematocida parisii]KAI5145896.1 hypothetical protein NEPAR07_1937 [Nematocida parisii]|eukprot:XP_013058087.1 hypothetical protein NEPG_00255 [Nematocida parisii ERTm1]